MSHAQRARVQTPNRNEFTATADAQGSSSLFTLLPAEIRQLIYTECWRISGNGSLRQHITTRNDAIDVNPHTRAIYKLAWTHAPCITNPDLPDVRYQSFQNANPGTLDRAAWMQRLKTEWCLHWACEEADIAMLRASGGNGLPVPQTSSFLTILRTCKRMYLEALPSLYASVTFVFTDLTEAGDFLARYTPDPPSPSPSLDQVLNPREEYPATFRSIEICIRATNLLTELYFPYAEMAAPGVDGSASEGPLPVRSGGMRLSMENNPWARVCALLARQQNLHALRIWFDTRDLRPWHKRVSEARLFAKLWDVRVKHREQFILALPELPERSSPDQEQDWVPFGLAPHHFLEGERVEEAPFVVVRGPRPNNWRVHMGDRFGDRFLTDLRAV